MSNIATNTSNSNIVLPEKKVEALRWVYSKLRRLTLDKKWLSEQIKEKIADAKKMGGAPSVMRMAVKLTRMTPEQQETWRKVTGGAAEMVGYRLAYSGDPPQTPLHGTISSISFLEDQRREVSELYKQVIDAAKEAQINTVALREFLKRSQRDFSDVAEWFDAVDKTGQELCVWNKETWDTLNDVAE